MSDELSLADLEADLRAIVQIEQHPAWDVVRRRVADAVLNYTDMIVSVSQLDLAQTQALRQRIQAYKELLDLPRLIKEQVQKKRQDSPANDGDGETPTEDA